MVKLAFHLCPSLIQQNALNCSKQVLDHHYFRPHHLHQLLRHHLWEDVMNPTKITIIMMSELHPVHGHLHSNPPLLLLRPHLQRLPCLLSVTTWLWVKVPWVWLMLRRTGRLFVTTQIGLSIDRRRESMSRKTLIPSSVPTLSLLLVGWRTTRFLPLTQLMTTKQGRRACFKE